MGLSASWPSRSSVAVSRPKRRMSASLERGSSAESTSNASTGLRPRAEGATSWSIAATGADGPFAGGTGRRRLADAHESVRRLEPEQQSVAREVAAARLVRDAERDLHAAPFNLDDLHRTRIIGGDEGRDNRERPFRRSRVPFSDSPPQMGVREWHMGMTGMDGERTGMDRNGSGRLLVDCMDLRVGRETVSSQVRHLGTL